MDLSLNAYFECKLNGDDAIPKSMHFQDYLFTNNFLFYEKLN